ncbi:MAG: tetratricopeptide repeat protein [Spirochaetaceae bacterium]|nr:tetratricopeptide repeat protein [Spirochaetaceae bacterium]
MVTLAIAALLCGCTSTGTPRLRESVAPEAQETVFPAARAARSAEVLQDARGLLEVGSPQALRDMLTMIEDAGLSQSEYGRMMNAVAMLIIDRMYPDAGITHGDTSPPAHLPYAKILNDVAEGKWTPPPGDSTDYLTNVLPCFVLTNSAAADMNNAALFFLQKARRINPSGVLAVYFSALIYERTGRLPEARALYDEAITLSKAECYPAFLGIARILARSNRYDEAIALLLELTRLYPDNIAARRHLANSYIAESAWDKADAVIAAALANNYRNPEFLLMQALVFIELGRYNQAQLPLDTYTLAGGLETNRQYLFLRARLAWEGNRSRAVASTQLRAILAAAPHDLEAQVYLTRLLLGANQAGFQEEGRQMLDQLLLQPSPGPEIIQLALDDAITRGAWAEADGYLEKMLSGTPSLSGLRSAVNIKTGLGDHAAALSFARKAAEVFPDDEDARLNLIGMLAKSDVRAERDEGASMINTALLTLKNAVTRSRAYFYRSILRASEEDAINDLRTSLLEDPRNVDALLGLITIYDKRKDSRRATFYLQQALVLAPNDPEVNRLRLLYDR